MSTKGVKTLAQIALSLEPSAMTPSPSILATVSQGGALVHDPSWRAGSMQGNSSATSWGSLEGRDRLEGLSQSQGQQTGRATMVLRGRAMPEDLPPGVTRSGSSAVAARNNRQFVLCFPTVLAFYVTLCPRTSEVSVALQ